MNMKKLLLSALMTLVALACQAQYEALNGDLDHDGKITVADALLLQNVVLGRNDAELIRSESRLVFVETTATLVPGEEFNVAIKRLVDPEVYSVLQPDNTIKKITFVKGRNEGARLVSSSLSDYEAWASYDPSTSEVTVCLNADRLMLPASCSSMFSYMEALEEVDWSRFGSKIDAGSVTFMNSMFKGCKALTTIDFSLLHCDVLLEMKDTFNGCQSLKYVDISGCNSPCLYEMYRTFSGCRSLTEVVLPKFSSECILVDLVETFYDCQSLTSLDLSTFDFTNVYGVDRLFCNCYSLTSLNLGRYFDLPYYASVSGMCTGMAANTTCTVICTLGAFDILKQSDTGINLKKLTWTFID